MEFNITKETVQVYKLRPAKAGAGGWAYITIDAHKSGGRIQIASDYGSWQYYWGAAGENFKKFLIGLDIHYVAGKFGCGRHFDFDKTIIFWKREILRCRRDMSLDAEQARELYNEVKNVEENGPMNGSDLQWYTRQFAEKWMKLNDYMPETVHVILPAFQRFWDTTWQAFKEVLQKELEPQQEASYEWEGQSENQKS